MQPLLARASLPRFAVALALAIALAPLAASGVVIDWVTVGAPLNAADTSPVNCGPSSDSPCGAVAAAYKIGKYEVTNAQYAEFLNSVADTDTNALYSTAMGSDATFGGITRSGSPGSYNYFVKSGFASKPVTYVTFWSAARFANWLQNGQPTGLQTSLTTEDGAYTLTPAAMAANLVLRNPTASVFLPSENEWYKAAYYDPIAGLYYDYPTGTNTETGCVAPGADTGNSANCGNAVNALTDVGVYALSGSPSGTFDQGGNVWEWHEQIKFGPYRGGRGGAWRDGIGGLALGAYVSSGGDPLNQFDNFGFRVASLCSDGIDSDGDGVGDACDNCVLIANGPEKPDAGGASQRDTNHDGYGNVCDPDLDGNEVVNFGDLAIMKGVFFGTDDDADLNGDGVVNFADLAIMKKSFFKAPGPAAGKP